MKSFDATDVLRKLKRTTDGLSSVSYRKLFFITFGIAVVILYFGPAAFRWLFSSKPSTIQDPLLRCLDDRLTPFYTDFHDKNAHIHYPGSRDEEVFMPYTGNGYFGLSIEKDSHLNIKHGRGLGLSVHYHPIFSLLTKPGESHEEATVTEYTSGRVIRFGCYDGYYASFEYLAHRNIPSVFVQEIEVTNTKNEIVDVEMVTPRISDWTATVNMVKLSAGQHLQEFQVMTGLIEIPDEKSDKRYKVVSIVSRYMPRLLTLKKRGVTKLTLLTTIVYSDTIEKPQFSVQKEIVEKEAIDTMKKALQEIQQSDSSAYQFVRQHMEVWKNLWHTGFHISHSKAENALNGNRVNATMYSVLSQVRAFEFEESITPNKRQEIANALTYSENCYAGYPTLQADNLWKSLATLDDINKLVSVWLLTLEKRGCHNLLKAGASGVIQAMVLSFGGFRFSNSHLEFNIHPKFLHRDYHFRRLNYGNLTHVNITVAVNDDNKAVLLVSVDRAEDKLPYYGCDGGCLDEPVPLNQHPKQFPVKLTEPLTAILYITTDKQHAEDLRHALHVSEVMEAPAHQSHVIALHKHGHGNLGGLPTLFWFSICAIIIIFHVFLCKLIVKEYCEPPDKIRYRYLKP